MYNDELYHHGIKGQKWGVRHYQNEDGSLKPAGEGRYNGEPRSLSGNLHRLKARGHQAQYKVLRKLHVKTAARAHQILAERHMKKATKADEALLQKQHNKAEFKANKERLKNVDPDLAKNTVTKRVAYDYHNMSNREFMGKYKTSKGTFAKRYAKTNGDTYGSGLGKAARIARATAKTKGGQRRAAKRLTKDILYSEYGGRVGYNEAERQYRNSRKKR